MQYTGSLHDQTLTVSQYQPTLDNVHLQHLIHEQERTPDWSLSNGMRDILDEDKGQISAVNSDQLVDSNQDEMGVDDVCWKEDRESAEVKALVPNDGDTALENDDLEVISTTCVEELKGASVSVKSSSSSSSFSSSQSSSSSSSSLSPTVLFEVDDDGVTTTMMKPDADVEQAVDETLAAKSSPVLPETAPVDSPGFSTSEPPDLGDRHNLSAKSDEEGDSGRQPAKQYRSPLADNGTPLSTFLAVGGMWKRADREQMMNRPHTGIHCPPPLPPPPTSPSIIAASARSPRRH